MIRYARLWLAFARNCLSRQMEFKIDFIFTWINEAAYQWFNLIFFDVILLHVAGLGHGEDVWTRWELYVLMGTVYVVDGLMMMLLYDNVMKLPIYVNRGELDFFLLKPVNTQFLVSSRYVRPANVVPTLFGFGIVVLGAVNLAGSISLLNMLLYAAMVVNGFLILYATSFIFQTMSFWLLSSQGFSHGYFMFYSFIMKPDSIFRGVLRILLTYVMPAVVIASWPARALMDKALTPAMVLYAFLLGVATIAVSVWFFRKGLRRYESASS
jgi:ABC-2 type transport system permease protein